MCVLGFTPAKWSYGAKIWAASECTSAPALRDSLNGAKCWYLAQCVISSPVPDSSSLTGLRPNSNGVPQREQIYEVTG